MSEDELWNDRNAELYRQDFMGARSEVERPEGTVSDDESAPVHACCGSWGHEHRYRCPERVWPATATPEIRRTAVRGECIAPAHAQIEDLGVHGLDYQQRRRLTEILAQVWDDGFGYGQRAEGREP